jgi:transcriptional regulator with XRE-family HTH domain
MPHRRRHDLPRRTSTQALADKHATRLAGTLGRALREARQVTGQSQRAVGDGAGLAQATVSRAENGEGGVFTLQTWARLSLAAGSVLRAYLDRVSAADQPRDAVHLRVQELLLRLAAPGGWRGMAEMPLDDASRGSRFVDVALERAISSAPEVAVLEVVDWLEDVGAGLRDWQRRLARADQLATARLTLDDAHRNRPVVPRVGGCWVLRATRRNRRLVREHQHIFRTRFPGSASAWIRSLGTRATMPEQSALLWVSVDGRRLWPGRLG